MLIIVIDLAYRHFSKKLQLSHEYSNSSKLECSSIISLHLGHSISMSSSNFSLSVCSVRPYSSKESKVCSSCLISRGTSLLWRCFGISIVIKNDYYILADLQVGESGVYIFFLQSLISYTRSFPPA